MLGICGGGATSEDREECGNKELEECGGGAREDVEVVGWNAMALEAHGSPPRRSSSDGVALPLTSDTCIPYDVDLAKER